MEIVDSQSSETVLDAGMWKRLFSNRFRIHRFRFHRFRHFYQNLS